MPKSLDFSRLKQFEAEVPRSLAPSKIKHSLREARNSSSLERQEETPTSGTAPQPARWPSRQEISDGQISIKAPLDTIERFKFLCKSDRRTYADMLDILMTHFEGDGRA